MPKNGPPPLLDGRETWAHDTPRPTSPPPPRRMMYTANKAGEIHAGLCVLRNAVQQLKQAGQSWDEIELAFFKAMKAEFGC